MRALAIVHQSDAGAGIFGEAAAARGWCLDEWLLPGPGTAPRRVASYDAVLVLGGAVHVDEMEENPWLLEEQVILARLIAARTPLLGVCLGAQLLAEVAGAAVHRAARPEVGWHRVAVTEEGRRDALMAPLAPEFEAFQWHAYEFGLPPGAVALARSPVCLQAFRLHDSAWGLQFHAEVSADDALAWVADTANDEDALAAGVRETKLRKRTEQTIGAWNDAGRSLCDRFLANAEPTRE